MSQKDPSVAERWLPGWVIDLWQWFDWDAVSAISTAISVAALVIFSTRQARAAKEQEIRRLRAEREFQARHVSVSLEPGQRLLPRVLVRNASALPIFETTCHLVPTAGLEKDFLEVCAALSEDGTSLPGWEPEDFAGLFDGVSEPVGQISASLVDGQQMRFPSLTADEVLHKKDKAGNDISILRPGVKDFHALVVFSDSLGSRWIRDSRGRLEEFNQPDPRRSIRGRAKESAALLLRRPRSPAPLKHQFAMGEHAGIYRDPDRDLPWFKGDSFRRDRGRTVALLKRASARLDDADSS